MYQPLLREDQIRKIYKLKEETGNPMTEILREAVDIYLGAKHGSGGSYIITLNPLLEQEIAAHIISKGWKLNGKSEKESEVKDFLFERLFLSLDDCNLMDGVENPLFVSNNVNGKELRTSLEYIKEQLDYSMKDALDCPVCCKDERLNCATDLEHADSHTDNARNELEKLL